MTFSKILVANRGEIACRIFRTARRMGIATVAVYSEADRNALHVGMADEAVEIGPAPAAESYLAIDNIVAACRKAGADAVHPGYGFLSENPAFARALESAGIAFIGPPPGAIETMGDKIASKMIAAEAGVAIIPGHAGVVSSVAEAERIAEEIGYPLMIKASAGGGGKGMRVVRSHDELAEALGLASSEARSAFGDDRVLVEKAIAGPRHIEIQVLADGHGNVIHLGERECSIQRRNQKVVEESPSPFLDPPTRAAMGAQAVALARAVGYRSAGTVEFIVDRDRTFYFLEMNTRLQVEHPVTELVTSVDLVEEMIRIAAGEPLRFRQADVRQDGWALEARIYAEDPRRQFLPSVGRLSRYRPPAEGETATELVRLDSGVDEGSEISLFYDPLVAKLCTHAPSREAAIDAMADALDSFVIEGIRHNISFLSALMAHPRWRKGDLSTGFIADEYPDGFHYVVPTGTERAILAAIAAAVEISERDRRPRRRAAKRSDQSGLDLVVMLGGDPVPVRISPRSQGKSELEIAIGETLALRVESDWKSGQPVWRGAVDGSPVVAKVRREGQALRIERQGASVLARVLTPRVAGLAALMPRRADADRFKFVRCPMPGIVVSIAVSEGQEVHAGESLATVEAMKMENVIRAEHGGIIAHILAKPGDSLAVDAVMMEFA